MRDEERNNWLVGTVSGGVAFQYSGVSGSNTPIISLDLLRLHRVEELGICLRFAELVQQQLHRFGRRKLRKDAAQHDDAVEVRRRK